MPILTFPSGPNMGRKQYVVRRVSDGAILHRNRAYANAVDDSEIDGLDPDIEYLAMEQDLVPDYDPRIFKLLTNEAKNESESPPTWHITYDTEKRPATEIKVAITNAETFENQKVVGPQEFPKLLLMVAGILHRNQKGLQITTAEQAALTRLEEGYAAISRNDQKAAEKFAQVDANEVPDISRWDD